jgi:tetratricopeptide (TPR) repeat protein
VVTNNKTNSQSSERKKFYQLLDVALRLTDETKYSEALEKVNQMKTLGSNYIASYYISGLLINIGDALNDLRIIEEGKQLLEIDFKKIVAINDLTSSANYNLANAFLFKENLEKNSKFFLVGQNNLNSAKSHYRIALNLEKSNQVLAQIFVNLGICFDRLGRVVEALECYDKALSLKPNFGMALGNKGKELLYYAELCGEHQGRLTLEAYSLLKSAISEVTPESANHFSILVKYIEKNAKGLPLDNPPKLPGYKIESKSKFEEYLINFCLKNSLYLNVCRFCQECNAAIGDTVTIKSMIVPANDKSYLILSSYLNEIKQDFVTARLLLILSIYPKMNLEFFDKRVTIIDTLDNTITNVRIQLVKAAFTTFYNILDKLAFFINDYLKLGIKEEKISFSNIWYMDKSRDYIKEKIVNSNNASLNAIFDIHKDLDYGIYYKLKNTRNALTHRFVKIQANPQLQSDIIMSEETLVKQTLELAQVVRNSIIYLLQFVHLEELKKPKDGLMIHLIAHAIPDKSKNRRKQKNNHVEGAF